MQAEIETERPRRYARVVRISFFKDCTVLLAAPPFREVMIAIGYLGAILLVFAIVIVWALRLSMASTRAQKDAYDQWTETNREACELNREILRVAQEGSKYQVEANRLLAELIDALGSLKQRLGEHRENAS